MRHHGFWATVRRSAAALGTIAALSGCVTTYQYNGVTYESADAALSSAQALVGQQVAGIVPASEQVQRSIEVVLPTTQAIADRALVAQGTRNLDIENYLVQTLEVGMNGFISGMKRRGFFAEVIASRSDGLVPPRSYKGDFVLWYKLIGPHTAGWHMLDPAGGEPRSMPTNRSLAAGAPRMMELFKRIENLVKSGGVTGNPRAVTGDQQSKDGSTKHGIRDRKLPKAVRTVN
jgi:hypothetical protein